MTWRIFCFDLLGRNQIRLSFHLLTSIWQMFCSRYGWIFAKSNFLHSLIFTFQSQNFEFSFVFLWSRGVFNRLQHCSTDWLRQLASLGQWHLVDRPAAAKKSKNSALTCKALSSVNFKKRIPNCQLTPKRVSLTNGFQICEILKNIWLLV